MLSSQENQHTQAIPTSVITFVSEDVDVSNRQWDLDPTHYFWASFPTPALCTSLVELFQGTGEEEESSDLF